MNRGMHRLIWSITRNAWVVASDIARRQKKQSRRLRCRHARRHLLPAAVCLMVMAQGTAPLTAKAQSTPQRRAVPVAAKVRGSSEALGQRALQSFASQVQAAAQMQAKSGRDKSAVDANYLRQQAQAQVNQVLQGTVQAANESGLPFLRHLSGELRYDFNTRRSAVSLNTIDSVYRKGPDSALLQAGLHNRNSRITSNLGAVYRRELQPQLLVGANAFLDYEYAKQHLRASVGLEAISPQFSLFSNAYLPMSGWKAAKREARRQERPVSGFDLGLQWRPQWLAGMNLSARYFRWQGAQVDYFDNGRTQSRAKGVKVGVQYRPAPLFNVGLEQTLMVGGQRQTSVMIGVQWHFAQPLRKQLRFPGETPAFDLDAARYNLVERENRIVLKTRRQVVVLPLSLNRVVSDPATGRITLTGITEPGAEVYWTLPDGSKGQASADLSGRYLIRSAADQPSGGILLQAFNRHGDRSRELRQDYADDAILAAMSIQISSIEVDPSNGILRVSGETDPDIDVQVSFPGEVSIWTRSDATGNFTAQSRSRVRRGAVDVLVTDAVTGKQAEDRRLYEPLPIATPTIDRVQTDRATGNVMVSGKAQPGLRLVIRFPNGDEQSLRVNDSGEYEVQSDKPMPSGAVVVQSYDEKNTASQSASYDYVASAVLLLTITRVSADTATGHVTITGNTEPGSTVTVAFPGGVSGTGIAGVDGVYAVTAERSVSSGEITVHVTDRAGNRGPSASHTYTDATAPSAPVFGGLTTDEISGVVTLSGIAEPGSLVTVTLPGGTKKEVLADAETGVFTVSSDGDVPAGVFKVSSRDTAGNISPEVTHGYADPVDKTPPPISIVSLTTDASTGIVTVSGISEAGALVTLLFPDGQLVTGTADGAGNYAIPSLLDVTHSGTIVATAADAAGNTSEQVLKGYTDTLDKTAPKATSITSVTPDAEGRLIVTGTAAPDASVLVTFPNGKSKTATAGEDGGYRVRSDGNQPSGSIVAQASDPAGNVGPPARHVYTDAMAPAAPVISRVTAAMRSGVVTVEGTAEVGSEVTITFPDDTRKTVTVAASGVFTATSDGNVPSGNIRATSRDPAGNESALALHAYADVTAPEVSIIEAVADATTGRVTVKGTTEAGARVTLLFPDAQRVTVTAAADGRYAATSPADVTRSGNIIAYATDVAGNRSLDVMQAYADAVDKTAPAVVIVTSATSDAGGLVTVTGTAEAGSTVSVSFPGGETKTVTAAADGQYTVRSDRTVTSGDITATATDKAGNTGPVTTQAYLDRTAPAAPDISAVDTDESTGVVTIKGRAEPGSTVTVTLPGGGTKTVPADPVTGAFVATSAGDEPAGMIRASSRDAAGNIGTSATRDYVDAVDKTPPVLSITEVIADPANGNVSVKGKTEAGASVLIVYPDGQRVAATAAADGSYHAVSPKDVMRSGVITANATDRGGNRSPDVTQAYRDAIDKTAPAAAVITSATADVAGRVTVMGTAEAGSTVSLSFPGGERKSVMVDAEGAYTAISAGNVPSGEILATATDQVGNTGLPGRHAYVDRTPPSVPVIRDVSTLAGTGVVTVQGIAEAGSDVTVTFPDASQKTVKADGAGAYTASSDKDVSGGTIRSIAVDAAGNRSPEASTPYEDTVDKTAPPLSISGAVAQPETGRVTVTGTSESGARVSIRFPDGQTAATNADHEGRYSVDSPADVTQSGSITASASDSSGNRSPEMTHHYVDTIDRTAPAAATITSAMADTAGRVTVVGTAEAGSTVTVRFPGGESQTVTAGAGGDYRATSARNIPTGTINVQARDAAGNAGPSVDHGYADRTAPIAPVIATLTPDGVSGRVTVMGSAEPHSTVMVTFPDATSKTVTAGADGRYITQSDANLTTGSITARATDKDGNISLVTTQVYTDTTAPAAPTIRAVRAAATGRVTVEGQAEPGSTVTVTFPDTTRKTVEADDAGVFTVQSERNMPSGSITATAIDRAGNRGAVATRDYIDTTVPSAPTIATVSTDPVTGVVTVVGLAEPGSDVWVSFPGEAVKSVKADAVSGSYRAASAKDVAGGDIVASAADAAGNRSPEVTQRYDDTVDKTAPTVAISTQATDAATGRVTVRGITEAHARVNVRFPDGQSVPVEADAAGNYTAVSSGDVTASGSITVNATDTSGNRSADVTLAYADEVDKTAPKAATISSAVANPAGRVTVMGRAEPGATLAVSWPGGESKEVVAGGDGGYSVTSDRNVPSGQITVTVRDAAGNAGAPAARPYTDVTPPAAPVFTRVDTDPTSGTVTVMGTTEPGNQVRLVLPDGTSKTVTADSLSGRFSVTSDGDVPSGTFIASSTDAAGNASAESSRVYDDVFFIATNVTSVRGDEDGRVTVVGQASPDSRLTLTFPNDEVKTVTANRAGAYTVRSDGNIPSGAIKVQTRVTASAVPTSITYDYVDEIAPKIPVILSATADASGRVQVVGTAEPDSTVTVSFPGGETQRVIADNRGAYSSKSAANVPISGSITAQARDKAGNSGPPVSLRYEDRTPPPAPTVAVSRGAPFEVIVSGVAEPGSTVTIMLSDYPTKTTVKAHSTTGSYRVKVAVLPVFRTSASVTATDAAGNRSPVARGSYRW